MYKYKIYGQVDNLVSNGRVDIDYPNSKSNFDDFEGFYVSFDLHDIMLYDSNIYSGKYVTIYFETSVKISGLRSPHLDMIDDDCKIIGVKSG